MTIKRRLKRIWVIVSVIWVVWAVMIFIAYSAEHDFAVWTITVLISGILAMWWAIYWGISGFFSDEEKSDEEK